MLSKFREERDKRKVATPAAGPPSAGISARTGSEHRSSRDDRDRYERHSSSRYEYVHGPLLRDAMIDLFFQRAAARSRAFAVPWAQTVLMGVFAVRQIEGLHNCEIVFVNVN